MILYSKIQANVVEKRKKVKMAEISEKSQDTTECLADALQHFFAKFCTFYKNSTMKQSEGSGERNA